MSTVTATVEQLHRIWKPPAGLVGFFAAVNHRTVGVRYIVTGLAFFALAGIAAVLMRIQLMFPNNTFLDAELYNQVFTMHGTTMMFLFATNFFNPLAGGDPHLTLYIAPHALGTE